MTGRNEKAPDGREPTRGVTSQRQGQSWHTHARKQNLSTGAARLDFLIYRAALAGRPVGVDDLVRATGATERTVRLWLRELDQ